MKIEDDPEKGRKVVKHLQPNVFEFMSAMGKKPPELKEY